MLDVHVGRPPGRRLPGRHADGHHLSATAQSPATLRDKYREGVELILRAWNEPEPVRVQRQIHAAALRQSVAAADPEAASAGLDSGRRQRRDLGLVRRQRLPLRQPVLLRLHGRPEGDGRVLGDGRAPRRGAQSVSRRLPAIRRRGRQRRRGRAALCRAGAVFLQPLPPHLSGFCQPAGLYQRRRPCARASRAAVRQRRRSSVQRQDLA